jgi:hypothetical protein
LPGRIVVTAAAALVTQKMKKRGIWATEGLRCRFRSGPYVGRAYHPRGGGQTTSLATQDMMRNDIASKSGLANAWPNHS